ncbi:MAG: 3-phosphoglycerate dehydrogenase [Betaproteobacteria bacterium]|nr:MAG: 3-phosphoglycerate dehydrogenase [Betaproteobacteria bacterium]
MNADSRRYRVAVTELGMRVEDVPADILARCDLVCGPTDRRLTAEEALQLARGADALLHTSRDAVSRGLMAGASRLRVVVKLGGKPSNLDFEAADELGVAVGWTPGANVRSVAEYAVLLSLSALRRIDKGIATLAGGGWRSADHIGYELQGRTVGIVGLGAIGQAAARLFAGFGVTLLAFDPYQRPETFAAAGARQAGLDELLRASDVVTLHCELTPETRGLIDARALAAMKRGAVLINTARGDLVDESALIAALHDGVLSAAAIDVFSEEPLPPGHRFRNVPNLIATPHISARSLEALQRERFWGLRGAIAYLDGHPVENMHLIRPTSPSRGATARDTAQGA